MDGLINGWTEVDGHGLMDGWMIGQMDDWTRKSKKMKKIILRVKRKDDGDEGSKDLREEG
jgi:hypothetical protein